MRRLSIIDLKGGNQANLQRGTDQVTLTNHLQTRGETEITTNRASSGELFGKHVATSFVLLSVTTEVLGPFVLRYGDDWVLCLRANVAFAIYGTRDSQYVRGAPVNRLVSSKPLYFATKRQKRTAKTQFLHRSWIKGNFFSTAVRKRSDP